MKEKWTGDVVGKMHVYEITQSDLGKELGVTNAYISMLLNGLQTTKNARQEIEDALDRIIERKEGGQVEDVTR